MMGLWSLLAVAFLPFVANGDQIPKPRHVHHHHGGHDHDVEHEAPVWRSEDEPEKVRHKAEVAAEKAILEGQAAKKLAEASALHAQEAGVKKDLVEKAVAKADAQVKKWRLSMRETVENALLEQKAAAAAQKERERAEKVLGTMVKSMPKIEKAAKKSTEKAVHEIQESESVLQEAHARTILAKKIAAKSDKEAKYYKELAHALAKQHWVAEQAAKEMRAAKRANNAKKAAKRKASKGDADANLEDIEDLPEDEEDEEGVDTILWKKPLISRQVKDMSEEEEDAQDTMLMEKIAPAESANEPWAMRPHAIDSGLQPEMSRRLHPSTGYARRLPEEQLHPIPQDAGLWPEVHRKMRSIPNDALLPQEHRRVYTPAKAMQKTVRKVNRGSAAASPMPRLKKRLVNSEQN